MTRDELVKLINDFIEEQAPEIGSSVPVRFSPAIRSTTAVDVLDALLGWAIRKGKVS